MNEHNVCSTIIFSLGGDSWVMQISKDGIKFNREYYPSFSEDEFSSKVIEILEKCNYIMKQQ